jgi:tetratricopeptide (TPR) repeat protein
MTDEPFQPGPDHWAIIRAAASSSGLAVIMLDSLPADGKIPMDADARVQLADHIAAAAVGYYQRGSFSEAEAHCRAALALNRRHEAALALELALLRHSGERSFSDDRVEVDAGRRDPFVVALSYGIAAEPVARRLAASAGETPDGQYVTLDTFAAGYFGWRALDRYPNASPVLTNLAAALSDIGVRIGAQDLLTQALAIEPRDVHALNNLGNLHFNAGRVAEALGLLERAVAESHPEAEARLTDVRAEIDRLESLLAGTSSASERIAALYATGRYVEALDVYASRPTGPNGAWYAAHALLRLARWDEAAELIQTELSAHLSQQLWAAAAYLAAGRLHAAVTIALQVAAADPLLFDAYYLLATIYRQAGDERNEAEAVAALFMVDRLEAAGPRTDPRTEFEPD